MPLWRSKRDFGHGTGHGVGYFLGVHEAPPDFRQNMDGRPLKAGLIHSDEPGIYREGMHGVRHESLLLCKDAGTNEFGSWLCYENITLCHIDTSIVVKELMSADELAWLNAYNAHVYAVLAPLLPAQVAEWLRGKTEAVQ
jgi:Xaa-Pro aminopeptidase